MNAANGKPHWGVFLAATGSNAGKTSAALGLISALGARGLSTQAAKAGPDFLDAAWLSKCSGQPCPNLDLFMGANGGWQKCWDRFAANGDFDLVEGAMGLFDGDDSGRTSGALLANEMGLPILLLLNARGIGQSIAAIAQGFLHFQPPHLSSPPRFCGIICTHVASERHWNMLSAALNPVCASSGVPNLGYLPMAGAPQLASRHLGLKQVCESSFDFAAYGQWFAAHVDLSALLQRCIRTAPTVNVQKVAAADITVGIAGDEAFAFCYADLPLLLAELGAETVFFSPLRDKHLPDCDAIYIPGGYPELHCEKLAANGGMAASLRDAASAGIPIFGECGGYMYLMEAIVDGDGTRWPMLGLLPGAASMGTKLAALGYRIAEGDDWEDQIYGHEFHYAHGAPVPSPLWRCSGSDGRPVASITARRGSVTGTWMHLYPEGARPFWRQWLAKARRQRFQRAQWS